MPPDARTEQCKLHSEELNRIGRRCDEIMAALTGTRLSPGGLVSTVAEHGHRIAAIEDARTKLTGAVVVIGAAASGVAAVGAAVINHYWK